MTKKGLPIQANCMDQVLAHLVFITYIVPYQKRCIKGLKKCWNQKDVVIHNWKNLEDGIPR